MKPLFLTLLLAVAWQAQATNPPPRDAVLSISARDSQNPDRVAYSGGKLEMIGEGRGASLYATYGPKEYGVPRWISEGAASVLARGPRTMAVPAMLAIFWYPPFDPD